MSSGLTRSEEKNGRRLLWCSILRRLGDAGVGIGGKIVNQLHQAAV